MSNLLYKRLSLVAPFFSCLFTVVIVDPGISNTVGYKPYDDGVSMDIFVKVLGSCTLIIIDVAFILVKKLLSFIICLHFN